MNESKPFVKSVHLLYGLGSFEVTVLSTIIFVSFPGEMDWYVSKKRGGNV